MFRSVGGVKPAETVKVFEGCTNKLDIKLQKSCQRSKENGGEEKERHCCWTRKDAAGENK